MITIPVWVVIVAPPVLGLTFVAGYVLGQVKLLKIHAALLAARRG